MKKRPDGKKGDTVKKIEAVIKPRTMDDVYAALGTAGKRRPVDEAKSVDLGFRARRYRTPLAMTVTKVKERRTRRRPADRGTVSVPRMRIDAVGREWDIRAVIDIIGEAVRTGTVGGRRVLVTRAKIDLFASDEDGEKLVDTVCNALKGNGKIFVHPLEDAGTVPVRAY